MDTLFQALVMGIVQGLTEFLPVSSSGHLIVVPFLLGWTDPFINSIAFSVMLHIGTLGALLVYFRSDWLRLVPAGLAAIRDRSLQADPDRRLAWLLVVATIPAAIAGFLLNDLIVTTFREPGMVAVTLVIGAVVLWLADRWGARTKGVEDVSFPLAIGIGAAQALALVPGISRSGISISAARLAGLDREAAARFSFLMATPIIIGAAVFEVRKLLTGEAGVAIQIVPLLVGMAASFIAGVLAIDVLLRYLRTRSLTVFVVYRLIVAAVVVVVWLAR
ncbi:MAG TPA: undecaprenyl-diphosphatase UppP [Candidatus Limnocylindrales bacterium]|jgi:undecaprenyl-diphosphatase|nr:undecaprenyl-diphosphatase UppP [Candidatus Limnocylindrales bacterium]